MKPKIRPSHLAAWIPNGSSLISHPEFQTHVFSIATFSLRVYSFKDWDFLDLILTPHFFLFQFHFTVGHTERVIDVSCKFRIIEIMLFAQCYTVPWLGCVQMVCIKSQHLHCTLQSMLSWCYINAWIWGSKIACCMVWHSQPHRLSLRDFLERACH